MIRSWALVAFFALAAPAWAQPISIPNPVPPPQPNLREVREPERIQIELSKSLRQSDKGPCPGESAACRAYLEFVSGYEVANAASQQPTEAERVAHLERAAGHYEASRALRETSDVVRNLALLRADLAALGDPSHTEAAIGLFDRLAVLDPANAQKHLMSAAEVARDGGDHRRAKTFYERAVKENPANYDARFSLLGVLTDADFASASHDEQRKQLKALLEYAADQARNQFPDLASIAYSLVMEAGWKKHGLTENALIGWIETTSLSEGVPSLDELPAGWNTPLLDELRRVVSTPRNASTALHWWKKSPDRQHAITAMLMALADDTAAAGDLTGAVKILDSATRIAPRPKQYSPKSPEKGLVGKRILYLEAVSQLARLYIDHRPTLDPQGGSFRALVTGLGFGTLRAAGSIDLLTRQRYHATLGVLLDDAGVWDDNEAINAENQLAAAVEMAERRANEDVSEFQPLPDFHRRLGEGRAKKRGIRDRFKAVTSYLNATSDYLDLDDLPAARKCHEEVRVLGVTVFARETRNRFALLETILRAREEVKSVEAKDLRSSVLADDPVFAWVFEKPSDDKDFVRRQQFKTLAALAARARESDGTGDVLELDLRTLEAARAIPVLSTGSDVEHVRVLFRRLSRSLDRPIEMKTASDLAHDKYEKIWTYGSGSSMGSFDIGWDRELFTVASVLGNVVSLDPSLRPLIRIDFRGITLIPSRDMNDEQLSGLVIDVERAAGRPVTVARGII